MAQSGTPSWASCPAQECQCRALCAGMIEPACRALGVPGPLWVAWLACVPWPDGALAAEPAVVQAVIPVSAAALTARAATLRLLRLLRRSWRSRVRARGRDIDMDPMIPHHAGRVRVPGPPAPGSLTSRNGYDAGSRWRSSSALRYSATTISVRSSTEVSLAYLSKVILPPCSRFTRSHTWSTWP